MVPPGLTPVLFASIVPELIAPAGPTGGDSYDLVFTNALLDPPTGQPGLYRVTLTDEEGRRWHLWRLDQDVDPAGDVLVHVPDVAAGGGTALADGSIAFEVATFAWPDFDPTALLFTDVEREYDVFSFAAPVLFTQD